MISKPYDQALADGDLHDWKPEDRADPERFNQANRYLGETLHGVENEHERRLNLSDKALSALQHGKADALTVDTALLTKADKNHAHSGLRWIDLE